MGLFALFEITVLLGCLIIIVNLIRFVFMKETGDMGGVFYLSDNWLKAKQQNTKRRN